MGQINLYKIDENRQQIFLKAIAEKFNLKDTIKTTKMLKKVKIIFTMTLYVAPPSDEKDVTWDWLLAEFNQQIIVSQPNPKAVLLIEKKDGIYAVTFGCSYFIVDKYCDRNFSFKFARKINYKEIKTTALTSPNSQRNKTINTYVNYNNLEFDSGESFTKIKAKVSVAEDFTIHNEAIEIGNSIRFSLPHDSLGSIADLILYIEEVILNEKDKYKIPVFSKVRDDNFVEFLNSKLSAVIMDNPCIINISEIDIIGATEIFNHNDTTFEISYNSFKKKKIGLNQRELQQYADENNFSLNEHLLDIKVVSYRDGNPVRTDTVKNLIDYTDDKEQCILSNGQWYQYNDDYLTYLADSIKELDVEYNAEYDFDKLEHRKFIDRKYLKEKDEIKYAGKTPIQIKDCIIKKYYAERYYNIMLEENHHFKNYDRIVSRVGSADIELMDSYKDNTMFAVKIGGSSGKLSYVVDQSIQALKAYKHNLVEDKPVIENVAVWIILERKNQLNIVDGKPDINELEMLTLKNKLDSWKKDVRILGYKPIVYINYVVDSGAEKPKLRKVRKVCK